MTNGTLPSGTYDVVIGQGGVGLTGCYGSDGGDTIIRPTGGEAVLLAQGGGSGGLYQD